MLIGSVYIMLQKGSKVRHKKEIELGNGKILRYMGYYISPQAKGRKYQVKWETGSIIEHFDFELIGLDTTKQLVLKSREKNVEK